IFDPQSTMKIITGENDKLDLTGSVFGVAAVTFDDAEYTGATLVTEIQAELNAVIGGSKIDVSYNSTTGKFAFAEVGGGETWTLDWSSGPNKATSIGLSIGFDMSADDALGLGATVTADYPLWADSFLEHPIIANSFRLRKTREDIVTSLTLKYHINSDGRYQDTRTATDSTFHDETLAKTFFHPYTNDENTADIYRDFLVKSDGTGRLDFARVTTYDGPRPEKLAFEDFWVPPAAKTIEQADIKIHRRRMQKWELEERRFFQVYDTSKVDEILKVPDRLSPISIQQQKEQDASARTSSSYGYAEWDIYECWLRYRNGGKLSRIIATYHERSNTLLRAHYNFYPDRAEPFITSRLFIRDGMFYGYGFAEMVGMLQEEISQIHNQRRDNSTVANTKVWRVNPDSKLHQGYRIYPSAMVPAEKDEIEPLTHGEVSRLTVEEEQLSINLAERRTGVASSQQGYGAGTMHGRKGVYTAMGTMALLQEGNSRTDLNVSDMRYADTKIGRLLTKEYAAFGIGQRAALFGKVGELLDRAFEAVRSGRIGLPIYSSTASINREVEKQNDLMLTGVMSRHYQTISGMLQQASSEMMPPKVRDYLNKAIESSDFLMKEVMRHFGYNEVERYVPEPDAEPGGEEGGQPQGDVRELQQGPSLVGNS
ncbi:hypothetical protein LCGC14_1441200, partial [marine sediment metagenome]